MLQVETLLPAASDTPHVTVVRVRGEVDIGSAEAFASVLRAAGSGPGARIVVSLEDCRYCDSTALAVIVGMRSVLGPDLAVVVRNGTPVYRLFMLTGMYASLEVAESLADAVRRWSVSGASHAPESARRSEGGCK